MALLTSPLVSKAQASSIDSYLDLALIEADLKGEKTKLVLSFFLVNGPSNLEHNARHCPLQ